MGTIDQISGVENEPAVVIRPSRDADVEAMLAIYRWHIRRGIEDGVDHSGTPQPDDLRDRRKNLRDTRFPHLVATRGGDREQAKGTADVAHASAGHALEVPRCPAGGSGGDAVAPGPSERCTMTVSAQRP